MGSEVDKHGAVELRNRRAREESEVMRKLESAAGKKEKVTTMLLEKDEDDDDQDAEWTQEAKELPGQNRQDLPNFSRMCDRFGVSDRAGAALFNAAMIDCNIVKKGECEGLLEKSKKGNKEKSGETGGKEMLATGQEKSAQGILLRWKTGQNFGKSRWARCYRESESRSDHGRARSSVC